MPRQLRVDPIDLHMSSDHVDMHHAELATAHTAANSAIEAAQVGWVGASAALLQTRFAEWQATTTHLTTELAAHSAAYRTAANTYVHNDDHSAEAIDGAV